MVSRVRLPGRLPADDQSVVLQVRLPANRLDQLMLLADRDGTLATTLVTELVVKHLDQQDPQGELIGVSAAQSPCGGLTASITHLPVMSGMDADGPAQRPTMASVTPLRPAGAVRPGSDCR